MHYSNDFENNLDCGKVIYDPPIKNRSNVSCEAYDIRWDINIHCLFTAFLAVNRNNLKDVVSARRVVLAIKDVALYRGNTVIYFKICFQF
jgi:hypothetical protein